MELYTLEVLVHGQKLELLHDIDIFSGDQNVDHVHFTFQENSEWFEMNTIFAVFSRYGGTSYKVPISVETGYAANIPAEVMQKKGYIYIGLFGEQGDNILTSSVLQFQLGEGAVSKDTLTPTNDIYEQFIEDLNAYRQAVSDLEGIQADIEQAQSDVSDLSDTLTGLGATMNGIEGRLTTAEGKLGTAEGKITTIEGKVQTIEGKISTAEGKISTIEGKLTTAEGKITAIEGNVTTLQGDVGTLQNAVTSLGDTVDGLSSDIGTMQSDIGDLQSDIASLQATLDQYGFVSDAVVDGQSLKDSNNIVDLSFAVIQDTASGDIASFTDGSGTPMTKCLVNLEPKQSGTGTPSPSNVRPISGHDSVGVSVTGTNVWNEEWEVGGISSSSGNSEADNTRFRSKNYIHVIPNTTYYVTCGTAYTGGRIAYYDANKQYLTSGGWNTLVPNHTHNIPSGVHFVRITFQGTTYNHDISINYPSTDHDYHAYNGTTYTTQLPQTVYGGTVDLVSGELVVDRAKIQLDSRLYWTRSSTYQGGFYTGMANVQNTYGITPKTYIPFICSHAETVTEVQSYAKGTCFCDSSINIRLMDAGATTTDWRNYCDEQLANGTPVEICCELATPQVYQLTPQQVRSLLGTNNVWSENGTVEVKYIVNLKDYIDKRLPSVQTLSMNRPNVSLNIEEPTLTKSTELIEEPTLEKTMPDINSDITDNEETGDISDGIADI